MLLSIVSDPPEMSPDEVELRQLAHEVRNLRRLVIAILILALVLLTLASLHAFFSLHHYGIVLEQMGNPIPNAIAITLEIGSSYPVLLALAVFPIASMAWLWLQRKQPASPVFAMLCLCILLMVFLVWTHLVLLMIIRWVITGTLGP